jgi:O-antigen/teichoic acid export membrane protein
MLVSAVCAFVCFRFSAGKSRLARPDFRKWLALLRPAFWMMVISAVTALQANGTILVVGFLHNSLVAGIFFWGFSLSSQAVFLLATNLQNVFFPVLTKVNQDPQAQKAVFLKLCSILLLAIVPISVSQWFLAEPFIRLVFHEKWLPAVSVVQWLSLGMLTQPLGIVASSLLLAQGKNKELAMLTTILALVVTAAAALGSLIGDQFEISLCVGLAMFFSNIYACWTVYRQFGRSGEDFKTIFFPLFLVLPLGLVGWVAGKLFHFWGDLGTVLCVGSVISILFFGLVHAFFPYLAQEFLARLRFNKHRSAN